jgi:serine/threonine-protein kinase
MQLLGEGIFAQAYAVYDPELERDAVLKIALPNARFDAANSPQAEARLLASLRHPGVVQVWDTGRHEGREYSIIERLDHTLADELKGALPEIERAVGWLHETALALDHIHRRGILHLDIGAHTILLDRSGQVRLTDFGVARAPEAGLAYGGVYIGTPEYIAPEQLAADAVGTYTDVWAFGTLMYLLFSGRLPFEPDTNLESPREAAPWIDVKSHPPPPPSAARADLPKAMDSLCLSCLDADVERRQWDCGVLADKLKPWLSGTTRARVFVSHAGADRERVEREVISVLESHGIRTWYCRDDVRSASLWERSILDALEASDWLLVVMTPTSMRSEWVKDEVHWAIDHRPDRILPVMMESCDPEGFHIRLRRLQAIDLGDARGSEEMVSALTVDA